MLRFHVRGPRKRNGKVGRVKGPCGKVSKRAKIFKATYPTGVYTVQFDQQQALPRKHQPARGVPGQDLPAAPARASSRSSLGSLGRGLDPRSARARRSGIALAQVLRERLAHARRSSAEAIR